MSIDKVAVKDLQARLRGKDSVKKAARKIFWLEILRDVCGSASLKVK